MCLLQKKEWGCPWAERLARRTAAACRAAGSARLSWRDASFLDFPNECRHTLTHKQAEKGPPYMSPMCTHKEQAGDKHHISTEVVNRPSEASSRDSAAQLLSNHYLITKRLSSVINEPTTCVWYWECPALGGKAITGCCWGQRSSQSCHWTVRFLPLLLLCADVKCVCDREEQQAKSGDWSRAQATVISGAAVHVLNGKQKAFHHTWTASTLCRWRGFKKPISALHLTSPWQSSSNENSPLAKLHSLAHLFSQ